MNQTDIPVGRLRAAFFFLVLGAVMVVGALGVAVPLSMPALAQTPPQPLAAVSGPGNAAIVNGHIEIDGQPFFPFGFFHVTHHGTGADLFNSLTMLAAAGFNAMHAGHLYTVDYGSFLDQAAQRGVRVITEFAMNASTLTDLINHYSGKRAVLAWNIADDVDDGTKSHAQVQALYTQAKTSDPRHLVSVSGFRAPSEPGPGGVTIATFMDVADMPGIQRYPIAYGPVRLVWQADAGTVDAAKPRGRPVIANLQAFNWNNSNGNRYPTAAEGRNMTYQALAAGVKGILYYTFFDASTNLATRAPALWAELKSLVPEVNLLAPAVLSGQMTRVLADAAGDRFASYWVHQGRVYVIVINASATTPKAFSLAMPAGFAGSARPLFSGRPSGMTYSNGQLTGTVQPLDVHAYVLDSNSVPPAAPSGVMIR
jgi:hypothetical protein